MLDRRTPPPVRPFGRLILPEERIVRTSNGATLHVVADASCPLTRLCVVASGGRSEAPTHAAATLAAQMMCEGSEHFDTARTADMLDFHGATMHGRATDHHTRLDLTLPPAHMHKLLPIMKDAIASPALPSGRIEACRTQQAARCAYDLSRVDDIAYKNALKLIAGADHPHVRFPQPEDYLASGKDELKHLLDSIWHAESIDAFLSGGVTADMEKDVLNMLESLPEGKGVTADIIPFDPEPVQTMRIDHPGAEQCAVQAMLPAIGREHPDYIPLRLAVTALGGFFGSRLMQNVREDKGYTYGITASLSGIPEGSFVGIAAECAPQYTEHLLDELRNELSDMGRRPLSSDELLRMRLYEQTRLAAVLDNAINTADHYLTALSVGMPVDYFKKQEEITASVTADQIADVSARYLRPELLRIVVAGTFNS